MMQKTIQQHEQMLFSNSDESLPLAEKMAKISSTNNKRRSISWRGEIQMVNVSVIEPNVCV